MCQEWVGRRRRTEDYRSPRALSRLVPWGRLQRRHNHLRSPRALDRPGLVALLGRFAPCGAYVVRNGSRALALRFRQGVVCDGSLCPCPSPGRAALAGKPLGTRSRPGSGWSADRFHRQEARGRLSRGDPEALAAEGSEHLRRPRGEVRGHPGSLEPPHAYAPGNRPQGGTERGRPLDPVRGSKHRSACPERRRPQGAAARPDREERSEPQPVERAGAFYRSPSSLQPSSIYTQM